MNARLLLLSALGAAPLTTASAQDPGFTWDGRIAAGKTIEVLNVNGSIRAVSGESAAASVTATRQARRSDVSSVRIEVVEHAGGVTICAVYPTPSGAERENACRPGGGQMSVDRNDVTVDFEVRVPAGVRLDARTVNGSVEAERLRSYVEARTVNGAVRVETSGAATATTVNGNVDVRMGRVEGDARFETVNGSVEVAVPDGTSAAFRASTFNGGIESDFAGTASGRSGRPGRGRDLRGTIGAGGPEMELKTLNGAVRLRRL